MIKAKSGASRIVVALTIALMSVATVASADTPVVPTPSDAFIVPNDTLPGQENIMFTDSYSDVASYLIDTTKLQNDQVDATCKSLSDSNCSSSNFIYQAVIPVCSSPGDVNCLESLGAINEGGTYNAGSFVKYFPSKAQNEYTGDANLKVPSGTSGAIFSIPGASHAGGSEYFATVTLKGSVSNGVTSLDEFSARVTPVQIQPTINRSGCGLTTCPNAGYALVQNTDGKQRWGFQGPGFNGLQSCVANSMSESLCAERLSFPSNIRIAMKVRLNQNPTGWLHGRLSDPKVALSTASGVTTYSFEGQPVRIPALYISNMWQDIPEAIRNQYDSSRGSLLGCDWSCGGFSRIPVKNPTDPLTRNFTSQPSPSGVMGMKELKLWLATAHDKATANPSDWSIRSVNSDEISGANNCFSDKTKLTGIVTTNATQYSAGPPTYNSNSGSLEYQVASPHFDFQGAVFKGTYDLIMGSDVVRCVYGFSKTPIKAEISVIGSDGNTEVATTSVAEKDGWMHLSANGFEFSSPQVNVKLTQDAPAVVAPAPAPSAAPSTPAVTVVKPTVKQVTITCVKGKTSKKVTAAKPVCPSGFKKK